MTETMWLTEKHPLPMLKFAIRKVGARKLRLFAVACCRRIWPLLTDRRSRMAIETCEQFADGRVSENCLTEAWCAANAVLLDIADDSGRRESAAYAVRFACEIERLDLGVLAVSSELLRIAHMLSGWANTGQIERRRQCRLLREICGNPFRPTFVCSPLLTRNGVPALNLARTIYEEKAFSLLPTLGDALKDLGCDNEAILTHCRQPGEHVRGCWALDLLLSKE